MKSRTFCAVAAALALGIAGCGDDNDDESGATGTGTGTGAEEQAAPTGAPSKTVSLTETEYKIAPAQVKVGKAGVVEFQVANDGQQTHALEVEGAGLEEETEDIAPGQSASLKVELEAGTYELYCPIDGHKDQGMEGTLTVAGGDDGGASVDDDDSGEDADEPGDDDSGGDDDESGGDDDSGSDDDSGGSGY